MTTKTTMSNSFDPIVPDWPAPAGVGSLVTTRRGGISGGVFASLNLGDHVGDDPAQVQAGGPGHRSGRTDRGHLGTDP